MTKDQATVGTRVRNLKDLCAVPAGTLGVIDQDYGTGVMVAWNLPPDGALPDAYREWDGQPAFASGLLRDGFDKETELDMLALDKLTL